MDGSLDVPNFWEKNQNLAGQTVGQILTPTPPPPERHLNGSQWTLSVCKSSWSHAQKSHTCLPCQDYRIVRNKRLAACIVFFFFEGDTYSGMKIFSLNTDFSVFVSFSADFIVSYCYNLHFFLYFQPELGLFTLVSCGFLSFLEHFQCFSTKAIFMSAYYRWILSWKSAIFWCRIILFQWK